MAVLPLLASDISTVTVFYYGSSQNLAQFREQLVIKFSSRPRIRATFLPAPAYGCETLVFYTKGRTYVPTAVRLGALVQVLETVFRLKRGHFCLQSYEMFRLYILAWWYSRTIYVIIVHYMLSSGLTLNVQVYLVRPPCYYFWLYKRRPLWECNVSLKNGQHPNSRHNITWWLYCIHLPHWHNVPAASEVCTVSYRSTLEFRDLRCFTTPPCRI